MGVHTYTAHIDDKQDKIDAAWSEANTKATKCKMLSENDIADMDASELVEAATIAAEGCTVKVKVGHDESYTEKVPTGGEYSTTYETQTSTRVVYNADVLFSKGPDRVRFSNIAYLIIGKILEDKSEDQIVAKEFAKAFTNDDYSIKECVIKELAKELRPDIQDILRVIDPSYHLDECNRLKKKMDLFLKPYLDANGKCDTGREFSNKELAEMRRNNLTEKDISFYKTLTDEEKVQNQLTDKITLVESVYSARYESSLTNSIRIRNEKAVQIKSLIDDIIHNGDFSDNTVKGLMTDYTKIENNILKGVALTRDQFTVLVGHEKESDSKDIIKLRKEIDKYNQFVKNVDALNPESQPIKTTRNKGLEYQQKGMDAAGELLVNGKLEEGEAFYSKNNKASVVEVMSRDRDPLAVRLLNIAASALFIAIDLVVNLVKTGEFTTTLHKSKGAAFAEHFQKDLIAPASTFHKKI